jgi:hypothetical protein
VTTAPVAEFAYPTVINNRPVAWQPLKGFQMRAAKNGAFETLLGGAAGPGKTSILIALAAKYAQHPKARVIFFRTVYKDTLAVRDKMQELYPALGGQWSTQESRWQFPSGGTIQVAHAKTFADITDYLGPEYTAVLWDELSLVAEERIWQMILGRIRSTDSTVPLRARASANPIGPGRSWLKERFVDKCGKHGESVWKDPDTGRTRSYVPGTAKDNPLLPASYWDGLKDLPPSVQAALRDGDWDMALGLFYPELMDADRLFVPRSKLPGLLDWHDYWLSYDWGFVHPAVAIQYVRMQDTVYVLDTLHMHRYQDEDQAASVSGWADKRCLGLCYAGGDAFAKRQAHSAVAETVADVFARYSIHMERANLDREAGAKVLRRVFADETRQGPMPMDQVRVRFVDTEGNRRLVKELQALVPDELNPNVPAKRDANEKGQGGDDAADALRYGLATPTLAPMEPHPIWAPHNVADGKADPAPWEEAAQVFRMPTEDGTIDRRPYAVRKGPTSAEQQFPEDF